jgi:hypothetical protein
MQCIVNTKILVNISIVPSITADNAEIEYVSNHGRFIKNHSPYE